MDSIFLKRFKNIISIRLGIKVSYLKDDAWNRLLLQRVSANICKDPSEYLDIVLKTHEEFQAVVEYIVNTETWFFREKIAFDSLFTKISEFDRPVQILDLACSSGEEPYTILMEIEKFGLNAQSVEIDAVDISLKALETAKQGIYSKSSFRGNDLGYVDRYFDQVSDSYILKKRFFNRINFQYGNVVDPHYHPPRPKYDIILCRNLLMYLHEDGLNNSFDLIRQYLRKNGTLIVSSTEGEIARKQGFESYFIENFQVYYLDNQNVLNEELVRGCVYE